MTRAPSEISNGGTRPKSLWRRLAWFFGIWAASVLALGVVAHGIKALIG